MDRAFSSPSVAFLEPRLTAYRIPLFNALAQNYDQFQVYFLYQSADNIRQETFTDEIRFRHLVLRADQGPRRTRSSFTRAARDLYRRLKRDNVTVLLSAGYSDGLNLAGLLYAKTRGVPFVLGSATTAASIRRRDGLVGRYRRRFVVWSDSCVAYSRAAKDYLLGLGAEPAAVFLASNAIDNEAFGRALTCQRSTVPSLVEQLDIQGPVLLFVGRLEPEKGLETLVKAYRRALASLPTLHLLLVGDGSLRPQLEQALGDLRNARITGFIQPADLPAYYLLADALVLPSLRETWGFVVNEAMVGGLPIIVSDQVGCANELVRNEQNGFIIPSGDPERLAGAIIQLFAEPANLQLMGRRSLEIIADYTITGAVEGFGRAIDYALCSARSGRSA